MTFAEWCMTTPAQIFLTILGSVIASSGFWTILQRRLDKRDAKSMMLLGLAHDRILYLGFKYIERGWITQAEYENLVRYLYQPYLALGGNGTVERVLKEIQTLPIRKGHISTDHFADKT